MIVGRNVQSFAYKHDLYTTFEPIKIKFRNSWSVDFYFFLWIGKDLVRRRGQLLQYKCIEEKKGKKREFLSCCVSRSDANCDDDGPYFYCMCACEREREMYFMVIYNLIFNNLSEEWCRELWRSLFGRQVRWMVNKGVIVRCERAIFSPVADLSVRWRG